MSDKNYTNLTITEKVRVNAHILNALEQNKDHFAAKFIDASNAGARGNSDARAANFQFLLNTVRDLMAKDIEHVPAVVKGDNSKHLNQPDMPAFLALQKEGLRMIQGAIEGGSFDSSHIQKLAAKVQHNSIFRDEKGYTLPSPKQAYGQLNEVLDSAIKVAAASKAAAAGIEHSEAEAGASAPGKIRHRGGLARPL